ncbi:hypothetical protein NQ315_006384 [Exocentrus adspersus]|uniref:Uncharacterized protein n=1 Tax=Exocentrus adspersus TaxID=1586481 RepID=A0AAV8W000_9CUCU|nr:hypothetical protein NQ315_006384 [Exocentrus adspersus]
METAKSSNVDENKSDTKKYKFYRKPSIKKKPPEVKQTKTSYKRMLNSNPLLKFELEGGELPVVLGKVPQSSTTGEIDNLKKGHGKNLLQKPTMVDSEEHSLQPNFNKGKPLVTTVQRSKSVKVSSKLLTNDKKGMPSILAGSSKQSGSKTISKLTTRTFSSSTSKFLSSTRLDNGPTASQSKSSVMQSNGSSTTNSKGVPKPKPVRRSLSAEHFNRKKGGKPDYSSCFTRAPESTRSLEDVNVKPSTIQPSISPIVEQSRESSIIFKTPSAYERRSVTRFTPKSAFSRRSRSLYRSSASLPSLDDLQKRLNDWLTKRGKSISSFHHLKCFSEEKREHVVIDEENKENVDVDQDLDKGSYEDLKVEKSVYREEPVVLNGDNTEAVAKAALEDLLKLIEEGYPIPQCEEWLELIHQKYKQLEEEPQYWECRAAIEQSRGNISQAVECYRTAIVQGAEVQSVDQSLDILLQKFSLLNISTNEVHNVKSIKERSRIVTDARNVFKSSIIQFAIQERKLKKNRKVDDQKKLVATPVRRSTRLSRSAYTSTPGVKICSSLQELDALDRELLDFQKNKALF